MRKLRHNLVHGHDMSREVLYLLLEPFTALSGNLQSRVVEDVVVCDTFVTINSNNVLMAHLQRRRSTQSWKAVCYMLASGSLAVSGP